MGAKRYLSAGLVVLAAAPSVQADARQQAVAAVFTVATADSMDLSYPKPDMPCACETGVRVLDLVRGERENTQAAATATALGPWHATVLPVVTGGTTRANHNSSSRPRTGCRTSPGPASAWSSAVRTPRASARGTPP